jgi:predicted small secreted protein
MIIHSPIISGSLTFADGGALALPNPTQLSGSFSGSAQFSEITSHIVPDAANTYDLGSEANYFRDLYISTGSLKGIGNGTVSFKLGGKSTGGLKVTDANDDPVEIEAKEITLKDTSGNGNNIKLKVQNGALKSTKVSNTDVEDEAAEPQTLQSNISGSLIVTGSTSLENTTIAGTVDATGLASLDGGINVADNLTVDASGNTVVGGTLDSTGLASLDGGVDVDGAFTVADGTGNVSTTGTLGVTGTSTLGVINASGLLSADAGIDVDGAFTVADGTGNVSTSGTLGAGNTTIAGTVDASGLASLDGGIDVDGTFTVADGTGNVVTSGTLSAGNTTVGTLGSSGLASLDGGIDVSTTLIAEGQDRYRAYCRPSVALPDRTISYTLH